MVSVNRGPIHRRRRYFHLKNKVFVVLFTMKHVPKEDQTDRKIGTESCGSCFLEKLDCRD